MGSACFVIVSPGEEEKVFSLQKIEKELTIGRHKNSGLHLQHITVSRYHAIFDIHTKVITNRSAKEDTMLINGQVMIEGTIKSLDRIQIGVFLCTYYGAELPEDKRVYDGKPISGLPDFFSKGSQRDGATFIMDEQKMQDLQKATELLRKAHLKSSAGDMWLLSERNWVIGKGADIPVGGWFTGSKLAVVSWTGKGHRISKLGLSAVIVVRKGQEHTIGKDGFDLEEGDAIKIAKASFFYMIQ